MKLYSKRYYDKKKIEISTEGELKEKDEIVEITQIPLLDKEDLK